MGAAVGIIILIALIGGAVAYSNWLKRGVRARDLTTGLSTQQLRNLFTERVARAGWSIVDDGNPMVAQSSLATGVRQQIGLWIQPNGSGSHVRIAPMRLTRKALTGTPTKGHTLRIRMNSFVDAVRAHDPATDVVSSVVK